MAAGDITTIEEDVFGTKNVHAGSIEGPASYLAGGFALGTALFGLSSVEFVQFETVSQDAAAAGFVARYDRTNDKVQVFVGDSSADGMAEVADAVDLSSELFRFMAIGRK